MKNVMLTTIILAVLITGSVTAQQVNRPLAAESMQSLQMNARNINRVHIRAMRDFLQRDKTVTNVDWMIVETGYVAKYNDAKGNNCRTVYNNRGDFVYTIRQYDEHKMPREVRAIVKREYYDFMITLVEQIEERQKPNAYVVHLEDSTTLMNVRVSEMEMEVMSAYMKSKPR